MKGLLLILLLPACGEPEAVPSWTETGVFSGIFSRLDKDGSGGIDDGEWPRSLNVGPTHTNVDTNNDGIIELGELIQSHLAVDPLEFLGGVSMPLPRSPNQEPPSPPEVQEMRELFHFLVAELEALSGDEAPSPGLLGSATGSGPLDSPDPQAFFEALAEAYHTAGRPLPDDLVLE